ncbi:MAG: ribonuclease H-like domain-containing protein [Chloroflexi bacterium]|nr:ribonuclease H-like domain-containing protein [Chloroflexota bacterium]
MIENSFVIFPGIRHSDERHIWESGVTDWTDRPASSLEQWVAEPDLNAGRAALKNRDARHFANSLLGSDRWRLYQEFIDDSAFLDIETTGLSPGDSVVTMVGVLDRTGFTAYIRGKNLAELPGAISKNKLIVTFNGASFDLPFLKSEFRTTGQDDLFDHAAHLDLRYAMRKAGYTGGLKRIEQMLGVGRETALSKLSGRDAITLWRMADEGEKGAMETLIRYNAEDVASLPALASIAYDELSANLPITLPPAQKRHWVDTDTLPFDAELVNYITRGR